MGISMVNDDPQETLPDNLDAWLCAKVQEALADTRPTIPHTRVMDEVQALIDRQSERSGKKETEYLLSIPGMEESLIEGMNLDLSELTSELDW